MWSCAAASQPVDVDRTEQNLSKRTPGPIKTSCEHVGTPVVAGGFWSGEEKLWLIFAPVHLEAVMREEEREVQISVSDAGGSTRDCYWTRTGRSVPGRCDDKDLWPELWDGW